MYLFAYGSNVNVIQMVHRLGMNLVQPVGTGFIKEHQLVFRGNDDIGYFYTIIKDPTGTHKVPVVCYKIDDDGEKLMDRCEGVEDNFYHKELMDLLITVPNGYVSKIRGIVYVMNDMIDGKIVKPGFPDTKYVARVLMGYANNEMPPIYIEQSLCECGDDDVAEDIWNKTIELTNGDINNIFDRQSFEGANIGGRKK